MNKVTNNRKSKPVNQFTKDGEFIATWESIVEASRKTTGAENGISKCCNKTQKTSGSFTWEFVNEANYIHEMTKKETVSDINENSEMADFALRCQSRSERKHETKFHHFMRAINRKFFHNHFCLKRGR